MQKVVVLGSTGSIGVNTLDVMARHPERYRVFALSAASRVDKLMVQCVQHRPEFAVMTDEAAGRTLQALCAEQGLPTQVLWGTGALDTVAAHPDADIVMAAIVGAAGLSPCLAAARAGKRLLLANKEALVVGGQFFMQAVESGSATLLPIDSEHSAIFQSLPDDRSMWTQQIDKIILTASGGPFRTRDPKTFASITPQQACAHPNWVMGQKISVDSATMMNKALEVIEARFLFGLVPEKIEVVIHPQSVIHSMVQYHDHSWPERVVSGADALDFSRLSALTFESLHSNGHAQRFPGLALAWQALRAPEGTTAVLNAANEVAVAAFLRGAIRFDHIASINAETLSAYLPPRPASLQDLLALDAEARRCADAVVAKLSKEA